MPPHTRVLDIRLLRPADHICVWDRSRFPVTYQHHGIVFQAGDDEDSVLVTHVWSPYEESAKAQADSRWRLTTLKEFLYNRGLQNLRLVQYHCSGLLDITSRWGEVHMSKSDIPPVVLLRCRFLMGLGAEKFNIFTQNCEHAAYWCKTGMQWCKQNLTFKSRNRVPFEDMWQPERIEALEREIAQCKASAMKAGEELMKLSGQDVVVRVNGEYFLVIEGDYLYARSLSELEGYGKLREGDTLQMETDLDLHSRRQKDNGLSGAREGPSTLRCEHLTDSMYDYGLRSGAARDGASWPHSKRRFWRRKARTTTSSESTEATSQMPSRPAKLTLSCYQKGYNCTKVTFIDKDGGRLLYCKNFLMYPRCLRLMPKTWIRTINGFKYELSNEGDLQSMRQHRRYLALEKHTGMLVDVSNREEAARFELLPFVLFERGELPPSQFEALRSPISSVASRRRDSAARSSLDEILAANADAEQWSPALNEKAAASDLEFSLKAESAVGSRLAGAKQVQSDSDLASAVVSQASIDERKRVRARSQSPSAGQNPSPQVGQGIAEAPGTEAETETVEEAETEAEVETSTGLPVSEPAPGSASPPSQRLAMDPAFLDEPETATSPCLADRTAFHIRPGAGKGLSMQAAVSPSSRALGTSPGRQGSFQAASPHTRAANAPPTTSGLPAPPSPPSPQTPASRPSAGRRQSHRRRLGDQTRPSSGRRWSVDDSFVVQEHTMSPEAEQALRGRRRRGRTIQAAPITDPLLRERLHGLPRRRRLWGGGWSLGLSHGQGQAQAQRLGLGQSFRGGRDGRLSAGSGSSTMDSMRRLLLTGELDWRGDKRRRPVKTTATMARPTPGGGSGGRGSGGGIHAFQELADLSFLQLDSSPRGSSEGPQLSDSAQSALKRAHREAQAARRGTCTGVAACDSASACASMGAPVSVEKSDKEADAVGSRSPSALSTAESEVFAAREEEPLLFTPSGSPASCTYKSF